jgi:hypothetical protein
VQIHFRSFNGTCLAFTDTQTSRWHHSFAYEGFSSVRNFLTPVRHKMQLDMDFALRAYQAIATDDTEMVSELMKSEDLASFDLLPQAPFADSYLRDQPPALSIAAFHASIQVFRYLLVNGAEANVRDLRVSL